MKVYTKGGDKGSTSLIGGTRISKDDLRVEAYGTVDELMAQIGLLHDSLDLIEGETELYCTDLKLILNQLMNCAGILALEEGSEFKMPDLRDDVITYLEERIDSMSAELKPIDKFTLPGGHTLLSQCHVCRTVCRRAERRAVSADREYGVSTQVLKYLNRLSDYLYTLGRKISDEFNVKEIYWVAEN